MKRIQVRSHQDENDPHPWAELDIADGSLDIRVKALNGLEAFRERNGLGAGSPPGWQRRPEATSHSLERSTEAGASPIQDPLRPQIRDEVHVLALTLDGALEFVPSSQQKPVYYAHLGWWDPLSSEWTVVDFVEA